MSGDKEMQDFAMELRNTSLVPDFDPDSDVRSKSPFSRRISSSALPATPEHVQKMLVDVRDAIIASGEEVEIPVEDFLHAGMYVRTIRVPAGKTIFGALIKIPTTVIVNGHTRVLVGEEVEVMTGYNVIQAGPGRMQVFVAVSDIEITMMFATSAQTVEEAEREFTDEYEQLQSRRSIGE